MSITHICYLISVNFIYLALSEGDMSITHICYLISVNFIYLALSEGHEHNPHMLSNKCQLFYTMCIKSQINFWP